MKGREKHPKTPRNVQTEAQVCEMPRDNITVGDNWMMIGAAPRGFEIVIANQRIGEAPSGKVTLNRRQFIKMVDWFNTGQWGRKKTR